MGGISVGILGPGSLISDSLVPKLQQTYLVVPMSRRGADSKARTEPSSIPLWISLMPIAALPERFDMLAARGARRVVALSSTSVFTKTSSSEAAERASRQTSQRANSASLRGPRRGAWSGSYCVRR